MSVQRVAPRSWGAHRTIAAAVRAAATGAAGTPVVTVQAGTYTERLVMNRPVRLVASGDVRVIGASGPALTVAADTATIQGLRIETSAGQAAVLIQRGAVVLEDCEIRGDVRISADSAPTLRRSQVAGGTVHIGDARRAVLEDCVITDAADRLRRRRPDDHPAECDGLRCGRRRLRRLRARRADRRRDQPAGLDRCNGPGLGRPGDPRLAIREPGGDGFRIDGQGGGASVRTGGGVVLERCEVVRASGGGAVVTGSAAVLLRDSTMTGSFVGPAAAGDRS